MKVTKHIQLELKTVEKLLDIAEKLNITQTSIMEAALADYFKNVDNNQKNNHDEKSRTNN